MSEMKTKILPVLPLGNGVLLPNMVVPLALETPDAKAAATAARGSDGVLIVVARVHGTYAPVGCVAKIVNTGRTPGGMDAIVVKGLHRAVIGALVHVLHGIRSADPASAGVVDRNCRTILG